jgi:hypothetical protein
MTTTINASTSAGLVQTADTSGILQLQTASTAAVTIDTSQNVGIGTASPSYKLDVQGTTANQRISSTTGTNAAYEIFSNTGQNFYVGLDNSAGNQILSAAYGATLLGTGAYPMVFGTNNSERMRIDSSGNVGIGSSTITSADGAAGRIFKVSGSTNTVWVGETTGNGGYNGFIFEARNSNRSNPRFAQIQMQTTSTATDGGMIIFSTAATGSGTDISERMRIDSSGNLNVGRTVATTSNTVGCSIMPVGSIIVERDNDQLMSLNRMNGNGTAILFSRGAGNSVGNITLNTSSTTYNTSSDYRLKHDIAPMIGALAKIAALKPVTYKWNVDGSTGEGFIAHELQEVVPDCVTGAKDAVDADGNPSYQGIDTSFLVATLTAAIQELKAINDTQAETINALTARIVALEAK